MPLCPTIVSQILSGQNQLNLGNISPTRDLTYVLDTCSAFYSIYKSNELFGETINIGMNSEISIEDLAILLMKLLNVKLEIASTDERIRPQNSEVERLYCDNSKLLEKTKWRPSFSLKEGLKGFIDWMSNEKNLQLYKAGQYNV